MDVKLTWRERMALRLHVSMCDMCGRYLKDLKKLRLFLRNFGRKDTLSSRESLQLPEQDRARIHQALHAECHPDEHRNS